MEGRAESSRMARATAGFEQMRLVDSVAGKAEGMRASDDTTPRSLVREAVGGGGGGGGGEGKGKGRARDAGSVVGEPLMLGEIGPRYREIEDGITMWCSEQQQSPFKVHGKFFYAVNFDDNTFLDNVSLDNCVFINVSFKGCILSDVEFTNVYLHDMEFIACDFNDCTVLSKGEFNQTWQDKTFEQRTIMGDDIPEEVRDPEWLVRMMGTQVIPEKVESSPGDNMSDGVLIHQQRAGRWPSDLHPSDAANIPASAPGAFDFSKLGQKVYETYNGPLDEATRKRRMAEWEVFAQEKEAERAREREEEELEQALAESTADASTSAQDHRSTSDARKHATKAESLRDNATPAAGRSSKVFGDLYSYSVRSTKPTQQPLHATSGNAQQASLPPHMRGKVKAKEEVAQVGSDSDDDDELDEPIYQPAARVAR